MASENGNAPDHLEFLRHAAETVRRYDFFALLRQAEARAPHLKRIGEAKLPRDDVVDLAHTALMAFPGATLDTIETTPTGRARVRCCFFGLTGPMGALPLHLTEFANYEERYAAKKPFSRFLDMLTNRMLQFFYRAWAASEPTAQADRPWDDRFAGYIASVAGIKSEHAQAGFPHQAQLYLAGLMGSRRSPAVLVDCLSQILKTTVTVREFLPRWRDIEPGDVSRIGRSGAFNRLGEDAVLGTRVRRIDDAFRVGLGCRDWTHYKQYMPTSRSFAVVRDTLDTMAPPHLEWQLELAIPEDRIEGVRLDGTAPLGWSAWLAPRKSATRRTDTRLGRRAGLGKSTKNQGVAP
jgi:type VI secretion system ImpH/TssG family protein